MSRRENRLEQGSALLIAVLMLVLMGLIGIAALDAVTRDGQVAGYLNRKKVAFFAAEAGVAKALETLNNNLTPTVGQTTLSDTAEIKLTSPRTLRSDATANRLIPLCSSFSRRSFVSLRPLTRARPQSMT